MGCGASSRPKATPEQQKSVCSHMAKEMMKICVAYALENKELVKVIAPKEIADVRKTAADLREGAKKAPPPEEAPKEEGGGGFMGKIGKLAEQAVDAVASAVEGGIGAAMTFAADQIDKAVDAIEEPLTTIGQDLITAKGPEIQKVYEAYIGNFTDGKLQIGNVFDDPVGLVRGASPYGPEEYEKASPTGLTNKLMSKLDSSLQETLLEAVREEIDNHAVIKNWQALIDKHNGAADKVESWCSDVKIKKIELKLDEYICEQVIQEIGTLMAVREKEVRKDSKNKSNYPVVFEVVFSGQTIFQDTYERFAQNVNIKQ